MQQCSEFVAALLYNPFAAQDRGVFGLLLGFQRQLLFVEISED